MTYEDAVLPATGSTVSRVDQGKKIAVVQFMDGTEVTTPVANEAEAKAIVMKAFKTYGNKVRGGYCATRTH